jgi:hypothetical protein
VSPHQGDLPYKRQSLHLPQTNSDPSSKTSIYTPKTTMDKVKEAVGKITGTSKLPTAKLGKNGPQVNRIGYGTMGLVSLAWEFRGERRPHALSCVLHVLMIFFSSTLECFLRQAET